VERVSSVRYRKWAQECLAMVALVATEHAKAALVSTAQAWHRLAQAAEDQERREGGAPESSPPATVERDLRSDGPPR
jgi:hypothetical protein